MRKVLSLLLIASFVVVSCQKEIEDPDSTSNNNGNNGNNGNNNSPDSYHPLSVGSWWKMKDTASGNIATTTVVNGSRTINNIVYSAMKSSNSPDTAWAASPKPNYYIAGQGNSPNSGAAYNIVFHFLNDTASVGYSWEYNAGQGNGFAAIIKTTIIAKGLSMTVEGKNYTNVIQSRMVLSYDILGQVMPFATYDYFVAKGVGIIKLRADINAFSTSMQSCSNLVDHKIM